MRNFNSKTLEPQADGRLGASRPVQLPFMAPRLQGDLHQDGRLSISVWGAGHLANFWLEVPSGKFLYSPNRAEWEGGGLYVAQSAPVLLIIGAKLKRALPARRGAWWTPAESSRKVERSGALRIVRTGWGVTIVEQTNRGIRVAAGETEAEALTGLKLEHDDIIQEAAHYASRCDEAQHAEPLVRSMVMQGVHAALSSIRKNAKGAFAGLAAGQAYSAPARTYYRDAYWTLQILLDRAPAAVEAQIDLLASGLQVDGEAPSGVILTGEAQAERWEKVRQNHPRIVIEHLRSGDWWSDHFDSPLFFILTIADYVRASGNVGPLDRHWHRISAIFHRYLGFIRHDNGLPYKPRNDRDWADNVYRHGFVGYDIGLWIGALDAIAELGRDIDAQLAQAAAETAAKARSSIDTEMLTNSGTYADYGDRRDFLEDHLSLDSLTLLRYEAVSPERARHVLTVMQGMLETRRNIHQPYGDWGVMCAWPPFSRRGDTREKSIFAYRYHNGSDWPYLTGLFAEQLIRYGLDDADYALTRWWQTCLDNGWAGAVEYFSPPWGRGSLLQGWSAMPAYVWLKRYSAQMSPQGKSGQ